jgi:hypothetical protein
VVQDLRRVMSSRVVPVALPSPESAPPKPGSGPRPAVGPVLPLTADTGGGGGGGGGSDGNTLIGDGGRNPPANADPVVTRVLTHGDALAAPSGRADDFSWPRPEGGGTAEAAPEPAAVTPPAPPPKGASGNPKKTEDTKPDTKTKIAPAAPATPAAPARRPSAALDGGPPRPPAPVGRGF